MFIVPIQSVFLTAQDSSWYPLFLAPVVETVVTSEAQTILDIGTGPGKLTELLIKRKGTLKITGIDIDSQMILEAKKRVKHENIHFEKQIINEKLNFMDASFDIVTFCSVLFLLDDDTKTFLLKEALRVLKPKGKIIILSPSGKKSVFSAILEMFSFSLNSYNWTFFIWKFFTSARARIWQKDLWLANYSKEKDVSYKHELTFRNNASLEIIEKV